MIKPIVKDIFFLSQKSEAATKQDLPVGQDLMDTLRANQDHCAGMTLRANQDHCAGMAANMIGVKKKIIIVNMGFMNVVMYNPVIVKKDTPYETEEGCLSLDGVRKTTRYQNITVEYFDGSWKKHRQAYSGWIFSMSAITLKGLSYKEVKKRLCQRSSTNIGQWAKKRPKRIVSSCDLYSLLISCNITIFLIGNRR